MKQEINSFDYVLAWLTFISGISISVVAVYYSVAGLMTIFAAAAIPIMIMGIFLESSKLVATVWLKRYWNIAPRSIKVYLTMAVIILMMITSMGIFGYLSKAHTDQAVPSADIASKVQYFDSQIKTHQDNIDTAKKALAQLDRAVDETMSRNDSAQGAVNAIYIRRSQTKERNQLQEQIKESQDAIVELNTQKAPIASQLRAVEAEVGPIKYIAALLYGDNVDTSILEKSVRAIIILIVVVFDPLAVVLLLTSQYSFQYIRDGKKKDIIDFIPSKPETAIVNEDETTQKEEPISNHFEIKLEDNVSVESKLGSSDTSHGSPILTRDKDGWYVDMVENEQPLAKKKFHQKGTRK